jgi:glucosamine-6-phosphate deaminase
MSSERRFRLVEGESAEAMGRAAAEDAAALLERYTREMEREVIAVFAAAPSQDTFLQALVERKDRIAWERVTAFHLDEYTALPPDHPNTFKAYLAEHIFSRVPIPDSNISYIKDAPENTEGVASWYARLFADALERVRAGGGLYVGFLGVGVNGHIGFNEPNTNLEAPESFLEIEIDETSVQQQYDDYKDHSNPAARYASLDDVPRRAVTMSVSAILEADALFCMVPGPQKAEAIQAMMDGQIGDDVPASLLRLHHNTTVYVDGQSARLLRRKPVSVLGGNAG